MMRDQVFSVMLIAAVSWTLPLLLLGEVVRVTVVSDNVVGDAALSVEFREEVSVAPAAGHVVRVVL